MSGELNSDQVPLPPPPPSPPSPPPELKSPQKQIKWTHYSWSSDKIQSQLPTHILLVTANDHEFNACCSKMEQVRRSWCDGLGMVYFGEFYGDQKDQNVKVALMRCAQGPSKAQTAVTNAAGILNPKVVLFVGICATMKPNKAKLGDVVISAKLATYDDKKVRADGTVEYRGVKANVSKNMALLILHAAEGWEPPLEDPNSLKVEVHRDAVMLSGSDLVDNLDRRQELLDYFKNALGLEMEGAGLYAAAYNLTMEWAVIKAVSDFGDGSKVETEKWQEFSSAMAASVVHNMFKYPDIIENWPHCQEPKVTPNPIAPTKGEVLEIMRNGRKIECSVTKREVYVGSAKDVDTGEMVVGKEHCFTEKEALDGAIEDLFKKLNERKLI